ncbi:GNAT family N-acetyltransferase [Streptomyces sp. ML-6]|uniref:GNAT family N-acetyltransferase n=1 Tax=Streptomyces sp. ML-6 TaxID=2982693 RepID=UPI0024C06122|nr:GNAT family N-acetyltransferase [Streptomyces sp. ML-6]MDK0517630.1 GNAT family N-acetyltransferase [Streptomyces sp. ML-6]
MEDDDHERRLALRAVRAAERVLLSAGCDHVLLTLPSFRFGDLPMLSRAGYKEFAYDLGKRIGPGNGVGTELGEGYATVCASQAGRESWERGFLRGYATVLRDLGLPGDYAESSARKTLTSLARLGGTAGSYRLQDFFHGGEHIGRLCLGRSADGRTAFVHDIGVEKKHQGRGHGRVLLQVAENHAASAGNTDLALTVFRENTRATHLYRSTGFSRTSIHLMRRLVRMP